MLDLDALPLGVPPAVPWYADRTIHSRDQAVPVSFAGALLKLIEVPTGFVAFTDMQEPGYVGRQVLVVRPDGKRELLAGGATDVTIASTDTGEVVATQRLPRSYGEVGATGKRVLLVDPTGRFAVEGAAPDPCYRIIRTSDQAAVWEICGTAPVAFSADGSELVGVRVDHPDRAAFEPSGDVVFQAWKGDRSAQVRCDPNGRCELATEPKAGDHDDLQKQLYFVGQRVY